MSGRTIDPAPRVQPKGTECRQIEELIMSRRTRRSEKRRRKRLDRVLTLLEQANADPKRRNRKTRKRELMNISRTLLAAMDRKVVSNANQA